MKTVFLDKKQAEKITKVIKPLHFVHPESLGPKRINKESDLFLLYILVGICHQINWNFLFKALDKIRIKTPKKITPEYLAKITHKEITSWLSGYPKKERLAKKMKRAELVQNMAWFLLKNYDGKILNLVKKSGGKMEGKNGMYSLLSKTIAYGEDPLRKKATVFVDLADEFNLINFSDWANYIPPIDYHISRILLRSGVVKTLDKGLLSKLMNYRPVSKQVDLAIRQACIDAIISISGKEGKRRKKIQGIFWALGRDCCHEEIPHCNDCRLKDCTCKKYILDECNQSCFLKEVCFAFRENKSYLKLREQNFLTTWY